jgi:hypothetical protein
MFCSRCTRSMWLHLTSLWCVIFSGFWITTPTATARRIVWRWSWNSEVCWRPTLPVVGGCVNVTALVSNPFNARTFGGRLIATIIPQLLTYNAHHEQTRTTSSSLFPNNSMTIFQDLTWTSADRWLRCTTRHLSHPSLLHPQLLPSIHNFRLGHHYLRHLKCRLDVPVLVSFPTWLVLITLRPISDILRLSQVAEWRRWLLHTEWCRRCNSVLRSWLSLSLLPINIHPYVIQTCILSNI